MGLGRRPNPEMVVFLNSREGTFEGTLNQSGIPTCGARTAAPTGNSLPDIVGKPHNPQRPTDVWYNEGAR